MIITGKYDNLLQFELLAHQSGVVHCMTTRKGGVSEGSYASFNLGKSTDDKPENIAENRRRLLEFFGAKPENLIMPYQTHSDNILEVDADLLNIPLERRKEHLRGFDAVITIIPQVCVGVTTADCVPLLAYDPEKKVVAAIHSGWRGTVQKIALKTVRMMTEKYGCKPENILVGIGAGISKELFEVGDEVVEAFGEAEIDLKNVSFRHFFSGKSHIDLIEVNRQLLIDFGILAEHIESFNLCTQMREDLFFSARRQTIKSGRMAMVGMIR